MIEIILMTFIWILWTLFSPLTQSYKYRKRKHTSFWFIYGFKNIVKLKVRSSAFQYLLRIKLTHSKMSGLTYKKFQLQEYLISPIFNNESRNLLFRLRTRTVSGKRMILEDYIQTPPVLWGVGKQTPYQTSWHVCHYYLNTKVLKWAAAIFVMKIYFLNIFKNKRSHRIISTAAAD